MSVLSKSEREGLEDVFLSIHSNEDKLDKIKEISNLIISKSTKFSETLFTKQAKFGIKENKFLHFLNFTSKKKKNLSK